MPDPVKGESLSDFLNRCIPIVIEDGTAEDNDQAVAICASMWETAHQAKSFAVKKLQENDQMAVVGGYGVMFGGLDLQGEQFLKSTDFMLGLVPKKVITYDHTLADPKTKVAVKSFIGETTKEFIDDIGIWVEAQIDKSKKYVNQVLKLIDQGLIGWSSATPAHLVLKRGKSITRWPIVEYALTPTPAEPRLLGVRRLKALAEKYPGLQVDFTKDLNGGSVETTMAGTRDKVLKAKAFLLDE